jgi:hypothetical protein
MLALILLACVLGLIAALYIGIRLYDRIRSDAMGAARVDVGRELQTCCAYLSREEQAKAALLAASDMLLSGGMVDGVEIGRKVNKGK